MTPSYVCQNDSGMQRKNRLVFGLLLASFLLYSYWIYTEGATSNESHYSESFLQGQRVWQEHNCSACHQLYGLGGYLGPDLTNVAEKGEGYVSAFVVNGVRVMPAFSLSKEEQIALYDYLEGVSESGYFPNHQVEINWHGNFKLKDDKNYEE